MMNSTITENNLYGVKTQSMPYIATLAEGQYWQINEKTITICDNKGIVRTFIKNSIQVAQVGHTQYLYPSLKQND